MAEYRGDIVPVSHGQGWSAGHPMEAGGPQGSQPCRGGTGLGQPGGSDQTLRAALVRGCWGTDP